MTTLENNPLRDLNNARNLPRDTSLADKLNQARKEHDLLQQFDLEELVHASFRYYLGRRTIATCAYARSLAAAWPHLSERTRFGIGRELAQAYAESARYPERQPLGADCDREEWDKVREVLHEGLPPKNKK